MPGKPGQGFSHRGVSVSWNVKRSRFEAKVTISRRADGDSGRKSVYGKTPAEIKPKIQALQEKADKKIPVAAGRKPTIAAFFTEWLYEISPTLDPPLAPLTVTSYWSEFKNHIFPSIGHRVIDEVTVAHLDTLYLALTRKPRMSPGHLLKIHAIIRRGLNVAMARDLVHRNVADIRGNPGSTKGRKRRPLSTEQVRQLLEVIAGEPTALRWMVGLALGPRQGEALGLTWACVDLQAGTIAIDWQLQRHQWRHGCEDKAACAAQFCRRVRCIPSWVHGCGAAETCFVQTYRCPARKRGTNCPRHERACPDPCPKGCDRHAARCPERKGGGLVMTRPKTFEEPEDDEVATDVVTLPPTLVTMLKAHQKAQDRVKAALGDEYDDRDLVFSQPGGSPVDPRADLRDWHRILKAAGLPISGTHVARHTAATVLYEAGEGVESIQQVLRHADIRTTRGYGLRKGGHLTAGTAQATEAALFSLDERRQRRATE